MIVDTNVFVSSLFSATGAPSELLQRGLRGEFLLVISQKQQRELTDVLQRPRIVQRVMDAADLRNLRTLIATAESMRDATVNVRVRDPKDQPLLAAAITGRVDYLVTGDLDLLVLADDPRIVPLQIVTPREFVEILEAGE